MTTNIYNSALDDACAKFRAILEKQLTRVEKMKAQGDFVDYNSLEKIIIGVCGGDGIGPTITKEAERVLRFMLKDEVEAGKVEFRTIDGLTIENRIAKGKAIPDDVMDALYACHIILKGPTTTPQKGDGIKIDGLFDAVVNGTDITLTTASGENIPLTLELSDRQRKILAAGGLLNYTKGV